MPFFFGILLFIATAAIICVLVVLAKLSQIRIEVVSASERLKSKEKELALLTSELAAVKEMLAKSQSELTTTKEELAGLHARSELERSQFDEKLAFRI